MSESKTLSIFEQTILVPKDWKPNDALIMHVATFDDYGAYEKSREAAIEDIKNDGGKPMLGTLRIIIEFDEKEIEGEP